MATDLVINATLYETRIALVEYGNLVEFYMERPAEKGLVGNIYQGKVVRVLPGMQAAFVEIGLERTGFLYVDDVFTNSVAIDDIVRMHAEGSFRWLRPPPDYVPKRVAGMNIEDMLNEGQELLVQVCKEPIGTKGVRLTCQITLPCRNLVFMPMTDHIGISRKIEDEVVKNRLRKEIEELRPAGTGFIVRTAAEFASRECLEVDMEFLLHLWREIQDKAKNSPVATLVHRDLDIILRAVRDIFSPNVDRIVVDDPKTYKRVFTFVETFAPRLTGKIHLCDEDTPVFDYYGVEVNINHALDKKIWLRCGGYIIIEATEALTVIDVNTGRYVGKTDLEQTIFKTNMEAVKEIAYQLRLRNIGGIIIIDFIDMEDESHREDVFKALTEAVKKDKSRVNILKVSEFGLVQMTRKRSRGALSQMMCEPCPYCHGEGFLKSRRTICYEIFRKISIASKKTAAPGVRVKVHPSVADLMLNEESATVDNVEIETGKRITIVPVRDLYMEKYEIVWD